MKHPDSILKKLLAIAGKYKYYYIATVIVLFALVFAQIAAAELVRRLINAIQFQDAQSLVMVIILSLLNYLIYSAAFFFDGFLSFILNQKLSIQLQKELFRKINQLSQKSFMGYQIGDLVARLQQNTPEAFRMFNSCMINLVYGCIMFISILIYMFWINAQMSVVILAFYIPVPFILLFFTKQIRKAYEKVVCSNKAANSFLIEILKNSMVIRVFNGITKVNTELSQKERALLNANVKATVLSEGMENTIMLLLRLGEAIIVYGFGGWLYFSGKIGIGDVFAIMNIFLTFISPIQLFSSIAGNYQGVKENAKVLFEILELPEIEQKGDQNKIPDAGITFSHVSFMHGELRVLNDVNFQINPGEKVLITGPNGIGKSTLVQLLLGLQTPDEGNIFLGETDINKIPREKLSKQFAYIPQRSTLVYGSIHENVAVGSEACGQDEADKVLSRMNLKSLIERIPEYYKSQTVHSRINISDGERQRISIARALIKSKETDIVIGDEMFSNIDLENRQRIISEIVEEWREKTVILINHDDLKFPFDKRIVLSEAGLAMY